MEAPDAAAPRAEGAPERRGRGRPRGSANRGATIIGQLDRRCRGCGREGCAEAREAAEAALRAYYRLHGAGW